MKKLVLWTAVILVTACSPMVWQKPGASQNDFSQDKYICIQEAQQRVSSARVNAYGGTADNTVVTNESLYGSCMNSKGWYLKNTQALQQPAQPQQNTIKPQENPRIQKAKEELSRAIAESNAACGKPEYAIVYVKSSCKEGDLTLNQLADISKISSTEKPVFAALTLERKALIKRAISAYRSVGDETHLKIASLYEKQNELSEKNALELYEEKISWGEYNKTKKSIAASYRDGYLEITKKKQ